MKDRIKNPYFWFGLIGVICSAVNINTESITSWDILYKDILNILGNPFLLLSVAMAITGVIIDPTSKGLRDNDNKNLTK